MFAVEMFDPGTNSMEITSASDGASTCSSGACRVKKAGLSLATSVGRRIVWFRNHSAQAVLHLGPHSLHLSPAEESKQSTSLSKRSE